MQPTSNPGVTGRCGACAHFTNDPDSLEKAFPGLRSMGSGFSSVRASDGICGLWNRYLPAWDGCEKFHAAGSSEAAIISRKTLP